MFNKLIKRYYLGTCLVFIFSTCVTSAIYAQELIVVNNYKTYKQQVKQDSLKKMVEVKTIVPGVIYDLRYGTLNNFLKQNLYRQNKITFLRLPVTRALARVQQELNEKGLTLKVWDAYRPYSVTVKMWEPIKDDRYVADPQKGSGRHCC